MLGGGDDALCLFPCLLADRGAVLFELLPLVFERDALRPCFFQFFGELVRLLFCKLSLRLCAGQDVLKRDVLAL